MGIVSALKEFFNNKSIDIDSIKTSSTSITKSLKEKNKSTTSTNKQNPVYNNNSMTTASTTMSSKQHTSSSGHNHQFKDGRRYHADESVAYVLPNDDDESDRVHEQHWILRHALQGNFFAPVTKQLEEGITVLDSGCGPATWTFEMAEAYPNSKFYGIDISCVFPEDIKPANVEFSIGNIAKELPYEDNHFDYIHQRLLVLGLTGDDWTNTLSNLFRALKPGGHLELGEPDLQNVVHAGPGMFALQSVVRDMSNARGLPPKVASELEDRLIKAGFVDVEVTIKDIPMNHSGKIGELFWGDYKRGYLTLRPVLAKTNPEWEDEATYEALINQCGEEVKNTKTCINWYSIQAKKPKN